MAANVQMLGNAALMAVPKVALPAHGTRPKTAAYAILPSAMSVNTIVKMATVSTMPRAAR